MEENFFGLSIRGTPWIDGVFGFRIGTFIFDHNFGPKIWPIQGGPWIGKKRNFDFSLQVLGAKIQMYTRR